MRGRGLRGLSVNTSEPSNSAEPILRIAAKGDGVTASGRFAWGAAPGDLLHADGRIEPGPHHVTPPCRHFGQCGGCQLQQLDEQSLAEFVEARVANASSSQELGAQVFAPPHLSPPASRRRASLRAESSGGRVALGFREAKSHRVVELAECHVMLPEFVALLTPLRKLLIRMGQAQPVQKVGRRGAAKGKHAHARMAADIDFAMTEQGVDLGIKGLIAEGLAATELMLEFAREHGLARIVLDQGYGPEAIWEPEPVTVRLGDISVPLPPGAFLQATLDGEQALVGAACEWLEGAANVADLFSGLGTFAFALAAQGSRVLAVEAARDAHLACKTAAERAVLPMFAMHRDLFRNPLLPPELARFDAVVLDPPRAGARDQVERLADSTVQRIVYISCNPSSWSRDAALLVEAGYRLAEVRPVGQFRWSTHVELASLFVRDR
ncbi:MAG: class I SAM-dependent RNA methyltransferase [Novosphingobium sp.]